MAGSAGLWTGTRAAGPLGAAATGRQATWAGAAFPLLFVTAENAQAGGADIEIVPPPQAPGVEYGSVPDRKHRVEIVESLLAGGADPNLSADDFGYPLRLALMGGEAGLVEALMNHGADPTLPRRLSMSARLSGNGHLLPLLRRRVTRRGR